MDTTQILLTVVISVLTILLTVIGIQVALILGEFRKSIIKVNKIIDDAGTVTGGISHTVSGMGGIVDGLKAGLSVVHWFDRKKSKSE